MFQDLKAKAWRRKLPLLTALLVAVLAVAVYFGPSLVSWAMGPSPFEQMEEEDPATLKGRYVEAEVTTLMDYYAETIRKVSGRPEQVAARDYLMPVAVADNDVVYVGLRLSKDSLLSANAVVADTVRMLSDMDGSYVWDGSSVSVRGTFQRMDQETEELYRDYLTSEFGVDASLVSMDSWFLPLVLVDGQIGRANRGTLILFGSLALLALAVLLWNLRRLDSGSYQQQIRSYLAAQPDPELALESLERFYSDTQEEGRVRLGKDWLLYVSGAQAWVLRADDVAWAYQHTFRQKQGFWTLHEDTSVRVFSVSGGDRFYSIPVFGERQAQELLERLFHAYPGLAVGYDLELQKAFSTDPAAFHAATLAARTGEKTQEQPTQPTETAPQENTPEQTLSAEPETAETDAPPAEKPETPCDDTTEAPAESEAPETTSHGEESGESLSSETTEEEKEEAEAATPSDEPTETIEEPEVTEENEETSPTDTEAEADEPTEPESENPAQDAENSEEPLSAEETSTSPEEPEAESETCPDAPDGEELGEEK